MNFEEYVVNRGPDLLRLATALSGEPQLAQDLTQTALLKAYQGWDRVSGADNVDAYVRRMLINVHHDRLRRKSSAELPQDLREDIAGAGLADIADGVVERDNLRQALNRLPPRTRTILTLRYFGDLDDRAIAAAVGIRPSSVRSTITRGLAALRIAILDHAASDLETR